MTWRKAFITSLFIALLAVPFVIDYFSGGAAEEALDREKALERYGFYFEEVAKKSGIDFVHKAPSLDPKLDNIMPQIASMGAGVSIVDFDRDGWSDIYLTNSGEGSQNALYRNNGDGTFTDVASEVGVSDVNKDGTGVSMGAIWGDFDNDGFEDLLVYKWGRSALYRNKGGKSFEELEVPAFPEWANINSGIWFDFDRDGNLDIFLGGYFREDINLWKLENTRIMPESFEYAKNGGRKYLLRNLGDGKFEEVSKQMGIDSNRWALAAGAADLTGNGYPDLFVANDYGVSELYINDDGKRFIDASEASGIGFSPKSGMNASFGDVMNDGRLSIYETNISERGILLQGNNLWVPREGTSGADVKFDNLANAVGVEDGGWAWGSQFGDFDNDGDQDIFLTNGYVSADKNVNYWYDFSKVTLGNNSIIADAANWPAMEGRSLSGYQQKKLWANDGKGGFSEIALAVGIRETLDGRAVAVADLWNRGVLDVIVANQKGPALIYKNHVSDGRNWIAFAFENDDAIGARITVFRDKLMQTQEIHGGSGYCSQNQRRAHFGLGGTAKVEKVVIRYPSGETKVIESPEINKIHRVQIPG
ncbi:MAG: CRTAC1 family protein [Acidobacteria bacterium]|nr:MAG: CRTAC1 family protein [Acidobacteriota bacterium]REK02692.1 MAG: CRTAC1 family protein [Acidobacteriota bacterium]REK13503.1 MAG: CRTAC1 family protein [Acidobacteriota bacterium]REK41497.1 MAG: CRTAC1 family protein [Acidobacteriota bacterium]